MVHIGTADVMDRVWDETTFVDRIVPTQYSVMVVRDPEKNSDYLDSIFEFLSIGVEHATTDDDLASMLSMLRPMSVIADLD